MSRLQMKGWLATLLLLVALTGVGAGQASIALTTNPAQAVATNSVPSPQSEIVPVTG